MLEHRYDEQTHCTKNEKRAFTLSQKNKSYTPNVAHLINA